MAPIPTARDTGTTTDIPTSYHNGLISAAIITSVIVGALLCCFIVKLGTYLKDRRSKRANTRSQSNDAIRTTTSSEAYTAAIQVGVDQQEVRWERFPTSHNYGREASVGEASSVSPARTNNILFSDYAVSVPQTPVLRGQDGDDVPQLELSPVNYFSTFPNGDRITASSVPKPFSTAQGVPVGTSRTAGLERIGWVYASEKKLQQDPAPESMEEAGYAKVLAPSRPTHRPEIRRR